MAWKWNAYSGNSSVMGGCLWESWQKVQDVKTCLIPGMTRSPISLGNYLSTNNKAKGQWDVIIKQLSRVNNGIKKSNYLGLNWKSFWKIVSCMDKLWATEGSSMDQGWIFLVCFTMIANKDTCIGKNGKILRIRIGKSYKPSEARITVLDAVWPSEDSR